MSITVSCPHCGKKLVAEARIAGREVACPNCKGKLIVPMPVPEKPPPLPVAKQEPKPLDFLESATPTITKSSPPPLPSRASQKSAASVAQQVSQRVSESKPVSLGILDSATSTSSPQQTSYCTNKPATENGNQAESKWRKIGGRILAVLLALVAASSRCRHTPLGHELATVVQHAHSAKEMPPTAPGGTGSGAEKSESISVADFVDNTQKFKGDSIEFEMSLNHADEALRQYSGGVADFYLTDGEASGVININIPTNLDLPNALSADHVVVTFDCNEGRLDSGNVATEIRRP